MKRDSFERLMAERTSGESSGDKRASQANKGGRMALLLVLLFFASLAFPPVWVLFFVLLLCLWLPRAIEWMG